MSDSNDQSNNADLTKRFAELDVIQQKQREEEARIKASYHDDKAAEDKAEKARVEADAEKERAVPKLDPLELIRQLQKMREEGFDEATIRAAFSEVMGELTGSFRQPLRRVIKSEGMAKMLTQEEMNKHYAGLVYPANKEESDVEMDERIRIILDRIEQTKNLKIEVRKPTLKNYLYRAAYFVLRRPLQFLISVLSTVRNSR